MQKYIEELDNGDGLLFDGQYYVLTSDYKASGKRSCVNLFDGTNRWLDGDSIIEETQLFVMDKDNNLIAIKRTEKDDIS